MIRHHYKRDHLMAIFLQEDIKPQGEIALWEITESIAFFEDQLLISEEEAAVLDRVVDRRKKEWLAGRYLLQFMSGKTEPLRIEKDEYGKPHLPESSFDISLSHSGRFAAAIASPFVVGIDVQRFTNKIKRIEHKFMTEEDSKWMSSVYNLEHLHVCWGAKEALYKAYGKKKLEFKEHILLDPFEYDVSFGQCKGYVKKEIIIDQKITLINMDFDIYYKVLENYMLVYAVQNHEK